VTGSYDSLVRIFDLGSDTTAANTYTKPTILTGHKSHINSLVFESEGNRFFTVDGAGCIKVWSNIVDIGLDSDDAKAILKPFFCIKTLENPEVMHFILTRRVCLNHKKSNHVKAGPIHWVRMHPSNRKLLIHYRSGLIKTFDLRIYRCFVTFAYDEPQDKPTEGQAADLRKKSIFARQSEGSPSASDKYSTSHSISATRRAQEEDKPLPYPEGTCFLKSDFSGCASFVLSGSPDGRVYVQNTKTL
jgi:hypothetical protein